MKTNTYGLKMVGLKNAASDTHWFDGKTWLDGHLQIDYDLKTGDIFTNLHADQSSFTHYNDNNIIFIADVSKPLKMQEIADLIKETMDRR